MVDVDTSRCAWDEPKPSKPDQAFAKKVVKDYLAKQLEIERQREKQAMIQRGAWFDHPDCRIPVEE